MSHRTIRVKATKARRASERNAIISPPGSPLGWDTGSPRSSFSATANEIVVPSKAKKTQELSLDGDTEDEESTFSEFRTAEVRAAGTAAAALAVEQATAAYAANAAAMQTAMDDSSFLNLEEDLNQSEQRNGNTNRPPIKMVAYRGNAQRSSSPDYTVQTMSMASVLDERLHDRFKKRVVIKASPAPVGGSTIANGACVIASPVALAPNASRSSSWAAAQLAASNQVRSNRLPKPKMHLTGRNAMTKSQEIEWKLSDNLPALADNRGIHARQRRKDSSANDHAKSSTAGAMNDHASDEELYLLYLRSKKQQLAKEERNARKMRKRNVLVLNPKARLEHEPMRSTLRNRFKS